MKKVVLYIAASMDNYIAKPDGSVDWLNDPEFLIEGEDFGYQSLLNSIDTTLMGNATYQEVLGFDIPFPYPEQTNYVFTRSNRPDDENVHFIHRDIPQFVCQLKNQQGKDIWLIGGGQINSLLLDHELIDRIVLTIMPLCLGDGIPLFSKGAHTTKFNLDHVQNFKTGVVQLTYSSPLLPVSTGL